MEKWEIPPPLPQKTDRHQNLHGWLRLDSYPYAKFHNDPITSFVPQMCENSHQVTRLVFSVLPAAYSQNPCTDFYDQYVKWRRFAQGCAFWGSRKQKFIFRPHFSPKRKFWANFWRDRNFRLKKALTMAMLTYKLPLIVIVALSLIHIWRCRRSTLCRSRWSPYH